MKLLLLHFSTINALAAVDERDCCCCWHDDGALDDGRNGHLHSRWRQEVVDCADIDAVAMQCRMMATTAVWFALLVLNALVAGLDWRKWRYRHQRLPLRAERNVGGEISNDDEQRMRCAETGKSAREMPK